MKSKFLPTGRRAKLSSTCLSLCFLMMVSGCADTTSDKVKSNAEVKADNIESMIKTGNIVVTENGGAGKGETFFNNPRAIGEEPDGNLIVADFSSGHIVRINRKTGDRILLSDNNNPDQGPVFSQAAGVAILPDGRIFVSDLVFNNVYEIDRVTGQRKVVSDESEYLIRQPFGITEGIVNGKRMIVIADTGSPEDGNVVGPVLMDPDTGKVTPIPLPADNTCLLYTSPSPRD